MGKSLLADTQPLISNTGSATTIEIQETRLQKSSPRQKTSFTGIWDELAVVGSSHYMINTLFLCVGLIGVTLCVGAILLLNANKASVSDLESILTWSHLSQIPQLLGGALATILTITAISCLCAPGYIYNQIVNTNPNFTNYRFAHILVFLFTMIVDTIVLFVIIGGLLRLAIYWAYATGLAMVVPILALALLWISYAILCYQVITHNYVKRTSNNDFGVSIAVLSGLGLVFISSLVCILVVNNGIMLTGIFA
ncbi:hypothetical protein NEHOM01_1554 [Nematocida homosporus]|uniref:uncharacterized protein n=1 Tax=Nematocida homosporus TaxID=1912981 RepID=UPI00221E9A65|nr:uncharacterized protein NEHOM01_1554 [Nematocida homosporus]KAI5186568.1 hypothetical protein NEHOM01_1554 [Nematocida homosporus]